MFQLIETIKCVNGRLFNLKWHNQRLNWGRKECFGLSRKIQIEDFIKIPDNAKKGIFRCRVLYSKSIDKIEFIPHKYRVINSLKLVEDNSIDYEHKYSNRKHLDMLFEKRGNCDDILIIKNGFVTDSYIANVVFFDGEKWWTSDTPLLTGTQRARLIENKGISVCKITTQQIYNYTKAGLINAMWDLDEMPIINIKDIK